MEDRDRPSRAVPLGPALFPTRPRSRLPTHRRFRSTSLPPPQQPRTVHAVSLACFSQRPNVTAVQMLITFAASIRPGRLRRYALPNDDTST